MAATQKKAAKKAARHPRNTKGASPESFNVDWDKFEDALPEQAEVVESAPEPEAEKKDDSTDES